MNKGPCSSHYMRSCLEVLPFDKSWMHKKIFHEIIPHLFSNILLLPKQKWAILAKNTWNKSMKSNSRDEEHRHTVPKEYNPGDLFPVYTDWEVANRYRLLNSVGQQVYFAQEGKCELWCIFCLWWRHDLETISALFGPLCWESNGHQWFSKQRASNAELWYVLCCWFEQPIEQSSCRPFEMPCCTYDVTIMQTKIDLNNTEF